LRLNENNDNLATAIGALEDTTQPEMVPQWGRPVSPSGGSAGHKTNLGRSWRLHPLRLFVGPRKPSPHDGEPPRTPFTRQKAGREGPPQTVTITNRGNAAVDVSIVGMGNPSLVYLRGVGE